VQGDYYDAIQIAEKVQSLPGFAAEGGARNIARRDGMGTVMLDAALTLGRMPDHYFQAVGSGTGGISAWEAALRLRADGRFGSFLPRLHLAQNIPNAPIYYAWTGKEPEAKCSDMFDDVLFNRKPPYAIPGGVKDALQDTRGEVYCVTDSQAKEAKKLFEQSEEIDILNAPAVAVAALQQAAGAGSVQSNDIILLNITGGGVARIKEEHTLHMLKPSIIVSHWEQAVQFLEVKR
jgi:cysteate synthase